MNESPAARARGGGEPEPPHDHRLSMYVVAWVVGALLLVGLSVLATDPADLPPLWLAGALAASVVVTSLVHVNVWVRGTREAAHLNELALMPVMVLLAPLPAMLVTAAGTMAGEALRLRGQWRKVVFNVAWQVVGVGFGSWAHAQVAGHGFGPEATHLAAGMLAGALLVTSNVVALTGIHAIISGRRPRDVLAEDSLPGGLMSAGTVVVGLLVAVLIVTAPLALPLVALLPLLDRERARARSSAYRQVDAARNRFEHIVRAASDGIVLLDREGRVEVWNPRMETLTGLARDQAEGHDLTAIGCAHLLPADPGGLRTQTTLGDRVVEVRRAALDASSLRSEATVLSIRDVSREAEIVRIHEDLVSRISHEFRTPVTTAAGFLDTLEARWDDLSDTRRRELIAAAGRGARRLGGLTANLMALSRIEPRIEPLDGIRAGALQPVDPHPVVEEVAASLGLSGQVTITSQAGARVWMDPADLRLVMVNLLDNAARYGAAPITVAVMPQDHSVVLKVFDRGPGVPVGFAADLFLPFSQASEGIRRTARGMGLGLAVVHSLVVANDGQVTYHPLAIGGACFTVTLPAARSIGADAHAIDSTSQAAG